MLVMMLEFTGRWSLYQTLCNYLGELGYQQGRAESDLGKHFSLVQRVALRLSVRIHFAVPSSGPQHLAAAVLTPPRLM